MPCGGIEPIHNEDAKTINDKLSPGVGGCWVCGRGGAFHMMHEWDTYIHARCALKYLKDIDDEDSEASILLNHKHVIVLDFSLEEPTPFSSSTTGGKK